MTNSYKANRPRTDAAAASRVRRCIPDVRLGELTNSLMAGLGTLEQPRHNVLWVDDRDEYLSLLVPSAAVAYSFTGAVCIAPGIVLTCGHAVAAMNLARSIAPAANVTTPEKKSTFEARVRELEELTANENWDSENGSSIPPQLWAATRWFHGLTSKQAASHWLEPFVSPSGAGTVHLTWTRDGSRLNLEIRDGTWRIAVKETRDAPYRKANVNPQEAVAQVRAFLG